MLGHSPQRLLELGHGEHDPAIDLSPLLEPGRHQPFLWIFLGQIQDDSRRFRNHEVAVDQYRHFSCGIEREEVGPPVLAGLQIDRNELELRLQFLEAPERAQRTGGAEAIKLHHGFPPGNTCDTARASLNNRARDGFLRYVYTARKTLAEKMDAVHIQKRHRG